MMPRSLLTVGEGNNDEAGHELAHLAESRFGSGGGG